MGRSRKKVHEDVEEERQGIRPGAAALCVVAIALGSAIVWNAFFGKHQSRSMEALLAEIPQGASTSVIVQAPRKPQPRTVTITYDALVEDLQRELMATGHYRGLVDGVMGTRTSVAIKQYQKDNGLAVDGAMSQELLDHIRFTRKIASAANETGTARPAAAVTQKKQKPVDARIRILDVQMRLARLGYDTAESNGVFGEGTRAAILQFELNNGLAMEGKISTSFMASLKAVEAGQADAAP